MAVKYFQNCDWFIRTFLFSVKKMKKPWKQYLDNTKRMMYLLRSENALFPKYSLLVISQYALPSQKQCRGQIIPALKFIKCTFNWLLLKPGPGPWKTWTLNNLDPEKPGPWKTWTLKNLHLEKPGSWKTWNKYRIKKYLWL